jgi:hypothetical protein
MQARSRPTSGEARPFFGAAIRAHIRTAHSVSLYVICICWIFLQLKGYRFKKSKP